MCLTLDSHSTELSIPLRFLKNNDFDEPAFGLKSGKNYVSLSVSNLACRSKINTAYSFQLIEIQFYTSP